MNRAPHKYAQHLWIALAAGLALTLVFAWIVFTDAWPWLRGPGPWPPSWRWLHQPLSFWAQGKGAVHLMFVLATKPP